jgi:hypothetical protein
LKQSYRFKKIIVPFICYCFKACMSSSTTDIMKDRQAKQLSIKIYSINIT